MQRFNRYLLFFIILGVGLTIAWTQVGRRVQLAPNSGLRLMSLEDHCRPQQSPCAAYAEHFALILGPGGAGGGFLMRGEKLPDDASLDALQLDVHSLELPKPTLQAVPSGGWRVKPTDLPGRLRIRLHSGGQQWVAEFPLS
jgi:hypothetical protein